MKINIQGINKLQNTLTKLADVPVKEALTKSCLIIERDAKKNCPVNTGTLRRSIEYEVDGNEAVVGTNLEYAPYVHQGTGLFAVNGDGRTDVPWVYEGEDGQFYSTCGQKPQPFLQDAADANHDEIKKIFKESIDEFCRRESS